MSGGWSATAWPCLHASLAELRGPGRPRGYDAVTGLPAADAATGGFDDVTSWVWAMRDATDTVNSARQLSLVTFLR